MMTMKNPIVESRIRLLVAIAALVGFTSCSSTHTVYDTDLMHGQSGGVTVHTSGGSVESLASGARLMLRNGWQVQTSNGQSDGAIISKAGFASGAWYPTAIPATVAGILAQAGVYPDPFVGTNFREWPGMGRGGSAASALSGQPLLRPLVVPDGVRPARRHGGTGDRAQPRGGQLPCGRLAQWAADRRRQSDGRGHAAVSRSTSPKSPGRTRETPWRC